MVAYWWHGGGHGLWWIPVLFMVAFLTLIVVLVVWRARSLRSGDGGGPSGLAILEDRFARGEIDREEFEQRRRVLMSPPARGG